MSSETEIDFEELRVYQFRRKSHPLFTDEVALEVLRAAERGLVRVETSLDLWLSREMVELRGERLIVRGEEVPLSALKVVAEDSRSIYTLISGELSRVEIRGDHFYKLVKTPRGHAPTLEIDGIHMHRVKGVYPEEDAYLKVKRSSRSLRGGWVLDTCTGLGYTAIWAVRLGASRVITVERDANVLRLAEVNPWSWGLESNKILTIHDDSSELIHLLPSGLFSAIIHDPPRFSLAGELYSGEFYMGAYRVLRPGGLMVHYVGRPGERYRGVKIYRGVLERMRNAGFRAWFDKRLGVVVAVKEGEGR